MINRRPSANKYEVVKTSMDYLEDVWADVLDPEDESIRKGDLVTYFTELKALSGGTVLIQGDEVFADTYDFRNSHEKNPIIRITDSSEDLGRNNGRPIRSFTTLYVPDIKLSREDPSTYLPPLDTSKWEVKRAIGTKTGLECLQELFDGIAEKTGDGWLIHLAEGRAGYLASPANVEAVLIREEAEYGEQDFLARFTGDGTLSGYGQYMKGDTKYYRIPALFAGKSLETLYAALWTCSRCSMLSWMIFTKPSTAILTKTLRK